MVNGWHNMPTYRTKMKLEEFKTMVSRPHERTFKVRGSWGIYSAYKLIRKNGWYDIGRPLKEHEFYAIVRGINKLMADEIAYGESILFPEKMGKLELRKHEVGAIMKEGKLKITYPIDWGETLKLWYKDKEAYRNKTLLRNENKYIYHVKYCVHDATYENKSFYQFALNAGIRQKLSKNIKEEKIDTLW